MTDYSVLVRYRTASGCNATVVKLAADSSDEALRLACDKIRKRKRVVRIDGGELSEVRP